MDAHELENARAGAAADVNGAGDAAREQAALAREAVTYAWPLYEMARMRAATSPRRTEDGLTAGENRRWCNLFTHSRKLLTAGGSRVVTPNNDTLYSNAWLDLAEGPLVIDVPDTAGRYYVLGLLDFYTNPFAHVGQRLTGTGAHAFVITPPDWRGALPEPFDAPGTCIEAPTRWLWVIGRILVDGAADVAAVNVLQDGFTVRPLADWLAGARPAPKAFDPACEPKEPLTAERFSAIVDAGLAQNPPPAAERARLAAFAAVGIGAAAGPLRPTQAQRLQQALDAVHAELRQAQSGPLLPSGWIDARQVHGSFGSDWQFRAEVALKYIGMLDSREAIYPMAWQDAQGQPLHGARRYLLHFAPGALPPVQAFWSLTLYDARDYLLVPNAIERYAIGDRTPGLVYDTDGGLSLHIQHAPPPTPQARANWLPAPAGAFYLCLRAYMPEPALLDGSYRLPALHALDVRDTPAAEEDR